MFTINVYLKFALIAVTLILGIWLTAAFGVWYGIWFILISAGLIASYLLLGTVNTAAQFVQKTDFAGAEKRLNLTLTPALLYVTNRAIYYIMKGSIAMNKKDNNGAEELFQKALSLKLPTDNEKAMVLLQLANINALKNKWNSSKNYFNEIKKLKVTEGAIKEQIQQFEKALSNRGQQKVAASMGRKGYRMMSGGGKRKRPKMK
jgi:tetratricopeptide (TPR) repeat protein